MQSVNNLKKNCKLLSTIVDNNYKLQKNNCKQHKRVTAKLPQFKQTKKQNHNYKLPQANAITNNHEQLQTTTADNRRLQPITVLSFFFRLIYIVSILESIK